MDKMTAKQKRFVEEYLIDLNATQAAIRAGYAEKSASVEGARLLANAKVAVAVAAAQAERSERTEITQDYVLALIVDTAERCKQNAEYNPAAVLKGAELLGRHLAMFTDKKTVTHHNGDRLDAVLERMGENAKPIGHPRSH